MSEYEKPSRLEGEPTVDDVRQLTGPSAPHFAPHLRNRIRSLISGLPEGHPARVEGEREIGRLDDVAEGSERRGAQGHDEPAMPSLRAGHVPESTGPSGAA